MQHVRGYLLFIRIHRFGINCYNFHQSTITVILIQTQTTAQVAIALASHVIDWPGVGIPVATDLSRKRYSVIGLVTAPLLNRRECHIS